MRIFGLPVFRINRRNILGVVLVASGISSLMIWPGLWRDTFSSAYLPHSFCYLSQPSLIWLHVTSDTLIGLAYITISVSLAYLVHRARHNLAFRWVFLAFGLFIVSCGMTHFMEVVVLWKPLYWLSGDIKVVTALSSVATAISLPLVVPRVLAMIEHRRLRLEQSNRRLEALNRRLVESEKIKTALVHETLAGVAGWELSFPSGEIRWTDDPAPLFGRSAGTLKTLKELEPTAHPEDRARLAALLSEPTVGVDEYDFEYRVVWPDGSVRWVAVKGRSCADGRGVTTRLVGLATDITNRKLAEEALRTSEKLAAAGRLAATIAHEINNPLAAVTNLLYLMRPGHNAEYLSQAEHEIMRISHIVKQTLAFYRRSPDPVQVDITALLNDVLNIFRTKIEARDIKVEKRFRCDDPIYAFSTELSHVFGNLIDNALDAMNPGGTLTLRTMMSGRGLRVTIADDGQGIPRGNLDKIFQPFFSANKQVGTGLGLWLTKEIVQTHGGFVRVRSSTDTRRHGTTFMIWLPLSPSMVQETAA